MAIKIKASPSIPRSKKQSKLKEPFRKAKLLAKVQPEAAPKAPETKPFSIECLKGGAKNLIIGIKIVSEATSRKPSVVEDLILHVPRCRWEADLEIEIATLRFVCQHAAKIPIPQVKAFDLSDISVPTFCYYVTENSEMDAYGSARVPTCL